MATVTSGWTIQEYSKNGLNSTFKLGARLVRVPESDDPNLHQLGYCIGISMQLGDNNLIADIIYTVRMDSGEILTGNVTQFAIDGRNRHAQVQR